MTWLVLSYLLATGVPQDPFTPAMNLRRFYTAPELHIGAAPHLEIDPEGPKNALEIGLAVTFQVTL